MTKAQKSISVVLAVYPGNALQDIVWYMALEEWLAGVYLCTKHMLRLLYWDTGARITFCLEAKKSYKPIQSRKKTGHSCCPHNTKR